MGYRLRAGVHFCDVGGRLVFLDLGQDRYFCLSDRAEAEFRRAALGAGEEPAGDRAVSRLVATGLLVETPHANAPLACPSLPTPTASALDLRTGEVRASEVACALAAVLRARVALHVRGLARVLRSIERRGDDAHNVDAPTDGIAAVAAMFERTAAWTRSHDQCLPRSIAVARRLRSLGLHANLVIGVQLRPFAAHCWVQAGEQVVNDRIDQVRPFQPILVI
mgnify:CR=1 FL=1